MSLSCLNIAVDFNLANAALIASDEVLLGPYDLQNKPTDGALNNYLIASVTATDASPAVFSSATTAPANGTQVYLKGSPAGFTDGTVYYVVNEASTTFELAATAGGTPITSAGSASGIDVFVYPYQPILPVTASFNQTGGGATFGGTPAGAGECPFLPGYSAVLYTQWSSVDNVADVYVEGSDDEVTWNTYATITGSGGSAMTFIKSLYRYIRVVAYDVTSPQAGTMNISLIGGA